MSPQAAFGTPLFFLMAWAALAAGVKVERAQVTVGVDAHVEASTSWSYFSSSGAAKLMRREVEVAAAALTPALTQPAARTSTAFGQPAVASAAAAAPEPNRSLSAPAEERAFFAALGVQIKQAWFLHGDAMIIMVGGNPYLVRPSKDAPVTEPDELSKTFGQALHEPAAVAQAAQTKGLVSLVLWVADLRSLQILAKDFSPNVISDLQKQAKLRGFFQGHEHTKETFDKLDKADLLKLGWSTLWLRGGMGREGLLKLALQASPSSLLQPHDIGSALLEGPAARAVEEFSHSTLNASDRADFERLHSVMLPTLSEYPNVSDAANLELENHMKDLLMALATDV